MLSDRYVASCALPVLALASVLACSALKEAPSQDATVADGGTGEVDGSHGDEPDASPSTDVACTDAWTAKLKSNEPCGKREVRVIEENVTGAQSISIARTSVGRVGIVYSASVPQKLGEMHLMMFSPSSPSFTVSVAKRSVGNNYYTGQRSKISASPPDTFHILSHDVIDPSSGGDATLSGDVVLVRFASGSSFSDPEPIVAGVTSPSELALVVDSVGTAYATVRVQGLGNTAKLVVRRKSFGSAVEALPVLSTTLLPSAAPGAGAASLVLDSTEKLHLLFHRNEFENASAPRYHTLDGADWSYRKTIDNNVPDGLCGYSGSLAVSGTKKYAAYYFRKAGQTEMPTAELHLASWELNEEFPTIELVDKTISSSDHLAPRYRVAMAVDRWGLLHMAIVRPDSLEEFGYLEYRRQTRASDGTTKWVSDIVDDDVLSASDDAEVDMVVDENGRPHIAYLSGKDRSIRYATRYDR